MQQSNSFKTIPSCPTPSHTPDCTRSWSRLSGLMKNRLDTPLAYYIKKRQSKDNSTVLQQTTVNHKVSLSSLVPSAPACHSNCFNAANHLQMVSLPSALHIPHLSVSTAASRGIKSVHLHSQRYNPTQCPPDRTTFGTCYSNLLAESKHQQADHLAQRFNEVEKARQKRSLNRIAPHRADCVFYMNGHSASINRRSMFSDDVMHRLRDLQQSDNLSENTDLYFGRGVRINNVHRPSSKAIIKLHDHLIQQQQQADTNEDSDVNENMQLMSLVGDGAVQTPVVSFSPPFDNKRLISAVYGKKAVFITEEANDIINS